MKLYYRAVSQKGKTLRGLIEAKDVREAAFYLRQHQLIPIKIIPAVKSSFSHFIPFLYRTTSGDLIFFTRQLASMLSAGLTLIQALGILRNQVQNPALDDIVVSIVTDIEAGSNFSSALEKHPHFFSPVYIALIRTAESSGMLDKVLLRLSDNLEEEQKLRRTIRSALLYPVVVVIMMIVVITVMMIFVIPQLSQLYDNINITLPLPTRIIIGLSHFSLVAWPYIIAVIILSTFYLRNWYKKDSGRRLVDGYILKVPFFGKLVNQSMTVEFTRTFGLLIGSGSLIVDSLQKTADVVGNIHYKNAITLVAKRVEKGIAVGDALEASPMFPPMVIEMVKIGEQTGKLDESLLRVSDYFEREVEQTVKTMTTLMEPIIMVFLALGVGFLIMAIITPIYNLMSAF